MKVMLPAKERRSLSHRSNRNSSWQLTALPKHDDGLPLVLGAIACLFGSLAMHDKGGT